MAIEDAACLGIVFSEKFFKGDIRECLQTYETVRKPRATRVQAAAAKARENINERIGKKYLVIALAGIESFKANMECF